MGRIVEHVLGFVGLYHTGSRLDRTVKQILGFVGLSHMGKTVKHVLGFVNLYHTGEKCRTFSRVCGPVSHGQSTVCDYIHDPGDTGSQQTFCYSTERVDAFQWDTVQFSSVRFGSYLCYCARESSHALIPASRAFHQRCL